MRPFSRILCSVWLFPTGNGPRSFFTCLANTTARTGRVPVRFVSILTNTSSVPDLEGLLTVRPLCEVIVLSLDFFVPDLEGLLTVRPLCGVTVLSLDFFVPDLEGFLTVRPLYRVTVLSLDF